MANQRERSRVKTLKEGLEKLTAILPSAGKQKKTMSRLETFKHAICYIQCLKAKLNEDSDQNSTTSGMSSLEKYVKDPTTLNPAPHHRVISHHIAGPQGTVQQVAGPQVAPQQVAGHEVAIQQVAGPQVAAQQVAGPEVASQQVAGPEVASQYFAGPEVASQQVASTKVAIQQVAGPEVAIQQVAGPENASQQVASTQVAGPKFAVQQIAGPQVVIQQVARHQAPGLPIDGHHITGHQVAFDSQVFENFGAVDNPPEQDVILNFDLKKFEEHSVVGPTTYGSRNQVQVAVTADTPQVAPQPGKHTACTHVHVSCSEYPRDKLFLLTMVSYAKN